MFGRRSIRLVLSTVRIVHRSARFAHRPVKLVTCSAGFVRCSVKLGRCSARLACRSVVLVHRSIRFVLNTIRCVRRSVSLAPCLDYFACSSGALGRRFACFAWRLNHIEDIPAKKPEIPQLIVLFPAAFTYLTPYYASALSLFFSVLPLP